MRPRTFIALSLFFVGAIMAGSIWFVGDPELQVLSKWKSNVWGVFAISMLGLWLISLSSVKTTPEPKFECEECHASKPESKRVNLWRKAFGCTSICKTCWNLKMWPKDFCKRF